MDSQILLKSYFHQLKQETSNQSCSQVTIRPAALDDINRLAELLTHSFHSPEGLILWLYPLLKLGVCEDLRTRFRSSMPNYVCLVAIKPRNQLTGEGEKIIGTVEISVRTSYSWYAKKQYAYIANLAVSNSYRRKGVGYKLLKKCEQVAYNWGFENIYLHVLENNEAAKKLYYRNGYTLSRVESNLSGWLTRNPRRLMLQKLIGSCDIANQQNSPMDYQEKF